MTSTSRFAENHLIFWVLTGPSAHLGTQAYSNRYSGFTSFCFSSPGSSKNSQGLVKLASHYKTFVKMETPQKLKALYHQYGDGGQLVMKIIIVEYGDGCDRSDTSDESSLMIGRLQ